MTRTPDHRASTSDPPATAAELDALTPRERYVVATRSAHDAPAWYRDARSRAMLAWYSDPNWNIPAIANDLGVSLALISKLLRRGRVLAAREARAAK